ncbi:MAG: FAD-binding oxidoreductase [Saprospiraceae bacterium]|nr:FAD-binding oxidoreductase [Saprospiraceae bacterium]NNL91784.1 FAD-binding oxidoreductase [Saprospiraceae bacterium]
MTIVSSLIEKLGAHKIKVGEALKERYIHIWKMDQPLSALCAVLPESTEDVSQILKLCHKAKQPIVIHGGLTNLVGNTETNGNEVVVSLEKMNKILEVDVDSRTLTAEAGVILENVQTEAKNNNLLFPLNFGAKGSAQLGGIISNNAGGLRVLRYGMTRNLVLGLEAVLPDGTIISSMKKIIKDNSGYDLKQLFIGAEGTLGIVTKAVLKLVEAPKSRLSAFVGLNDYNNVVAFLKFMDAGFAGILSGYELIWKNTYEVMTSSGSPSKPPLPYNYEYYVLVEILGSDQIKDLEKLETLLEVAFNEHIILDAAIASNASDLNWFWTIREDVHVLTSSTKNDQHFDISLPIPLIGEVINGIREELMAIIDIDKVFSFGHVADGNIHFIIGKHHQSDELIHQINEVIYSKLKAIGGSISAEHGVGVHKKGYLHYCRSESEMALMKILKKSLDPHLLLNRGKIFDI